MDPARQLGEDGLQVIPMGFLPHGRDSGLHAAERGPEGVKASLVILQGKVVTLLKGPKVGREELLGQEVPAGNEEMLT